MGDLWPVYQNSLGAGGWGCGLLDSVAGFLPAAGPQVRNLDSALPIFGGPSLEVTLKAV